MLIGLGLHDRTGVPEALWIVAVLAAIIGWPLTDRPVLRWVLLGVAAAAFVGGFLWRRAGRRPEL